LRLGINDLLSLRLEHVRFVASLLNSLPAAKLPFLPII